MKPEAQSDLYDRPVHLGDDEPLAKIVEEIPHHSEVLDLGCGPGILGALLTVHRGCEVDGVDYRPEALGWALARGYREVHCLNLEAESLDGIIKGRRYDVVVLADVLEHLVHPEALLMQLPALLKPEGCLFLSVPNVTHLALGLELLAGHFRYREHGLLDRSHLRFFSLTSLLSLLNECEMEPLSVRSIHRRLDQTEFDLPAPIPAPVLDEIVAARSDALVYQWIVRARVRSSGALSGETAVSIKQEAAIPDFTVGLYWGTRKYPHLSEAHRSTGLRHSKDEGWLTLMPDVEPGDHLTNLRIDPVNEVRVIWIQGLELYSAEKSPLWRWNSAEAVGEFINASRLERVVPEGILVLPQNDDPQWYPPIPEALLMNWKGGSYFRLKLTSDGVHLAQLLGTKFVALMRGDG